MVVLTARVAVLFALPSGFILFLFGRAILYSAFGPAFSASFLPMIILSAGQIINSFFGAIGILLHMSGLERKVARGMIIAAIMNLLLNFALVPLFGMNGAAFATLVTFSVWNIILWRSAWVHLRIDSRALPFPRLRKT